MGSGLVEVTSGYRPVLMATFALNYHLGGLHLFGYHLLNLLAHASSAILVYWIAFYLLNWANRVDASKEFYRGAAFLGALIFAVHPVQTESVTYISGRSSSLLALFYLASFLGFLRYRALGKARYLFLSVSAYACALGVKETAVTLLPMAFFLNLLFPSGRVGGRYRSLLPFLLVTAVYLWLRIEFLGSLQYQAGPIRSLSDHLLTQSMAWVHYLRVALLPFNLNVDYDFPLSRSIWEWGVLASLFILIGISVATWKIARKCRAVGFFALWFAVNLLPTNSLIRLEDLVTDRWLYLPLVGWTVLFGIFAEWFYHRRVEGGRRAGKWAFFFLCFLIVEFYGTATLMRNITWKSEWTLWEDAVAKSPGKNRPHINLGLALLWAGQMEEGVKELKRAIELNPRYSIAYLNLGFALYHLGRTDEAIEEYQKAIDLSPPYLLSEVYNNLGLSYFRKGRKEEGLRELEKAIQIRPNNANPYYNLGNFYEGEGDIDRAISYFETAARLEPEFFSVHLGLSRAYEKKGWLEKSRRAYKDFLLHSPAGRYPFPDGG